MAVKSSMFVFQVVIEKLNSFVESRCLVVRANFADIFSLELRDPKSMHIVMPEPPPLPPEPVGKKGKKKKKPPKKKKGKKGKKEPPPPPEPAIQAGQSVLFTSTAEFLTQLMKKYPMEVSLWNKEDNPVFIGSCLVHWDPVFYEYLAKVFNCQDPPPPAVMDEYNVFQEGTAKLIAKIKLQVKLSYHTDKVVTTFRTLSEDPQIKKVLYTGMNSKVTSFICNYKTTDEVYEKKSALIDNKFTVDKAKPVVYADYTNAPGARLPLPGDEEYCCMRNADKPPDDKYTAPETAPDIDFICDYVRKIISSCNDNMRMLTPRPTIRPRVRATDIDRLCYCRETNWPQGDLAERFRKEAQANCPICVDGGKNARSSRSLSFDIANIRGPCGRPECRIARDMRAYIQNLYEEDQQEVIIDEIIGPCGSRSCTLAEKVQQFIRHKGKFDHGRQIEGLPTQCACVEIMNEALTTRSSCDTVCSKDCEDSESEECEGNACPFKEREPPPDQEGSKASSPSKQVSEAVYAVYYCLVQYDKDLGEPSSGNTSKQGSKSGSPTPSATGKGFQFCTEDCPTKQEYEPSCSKGTCGTEEFISGLKVPPASKCVTLSCPDATGSDQRSPDDSDVEIKLSEIHNPCCVKTCTVAEEVKNFVIEGFENQEKRKKMVTDVISDPCYCDCICQFKSIRKTTFCPICGGYECLGEDTSQLPDYAKPHPCPVYHKLYDKNKIKTKNPFPEDEKKEEEDLKSEAKKATAGSLRSIKNVTSKEAHVDTKQKQKKKKKGKAKSVGKVTPNTDEEEKAVVRKPSNPWAIPAVPRSMGWLWTADDIPGMKPWPKSWRPGCAHKKLVRRYKIVREGVENIAKKKRAMMKRKKIEMKPTLVVTKHDGDYTVQMEVFKKYSKERFLNQYPYDEKPPLIYTIGKTEETIRKLQKQRERKERRETRRKSRLLQSTFRDKCQEICVKAYNQAIGLLPLPNANMPECPCDVAAVKAPSPVIDSCSCSESDGTISSSDSDGDDWVIEFTPPVARWNPKVKPPPPTIDAETQYTYLDYKVKLFDKQGNPIPRFFKGPDGKQLCSDLGGFWWLDQWQEINKDGFIGPDGRWIPLNFYGPDGMLYSSEEGHFSDANGRKYVIGIDGYIDENNKWCWYARRPMTGSEPDKKKGDKVKDKPSPVKTGATSTQDEGRPKLPARPNFDFLVDGKYDYKGKHPAAVGATLTHSKCLWDEMEVSTNKMHKPRAPNVGVATQSQLSAQPASTRATPSKKELKGKRSAILGSNKSKSRMVMSVGVNYDRRQNPHGRHDRWRGDSQRVGKYTEFMRGMQMGYDDLMEIRSPTKTNRASNTAARRPRKKLSLYTVDSYKNHGRVGTLMPVASSDIRSSVGSRSFQNY